MSNLLSLIDKKSAIFTAIAFSVGYLVTLILQLAFLNYYQLPLTFLEINFSSLFVSSLLIVSFLIIYRYLELIVKPYEESMKHDSVAAAVFFFIIVSIFFPLFIKNSLINLVSSILGFILFIPIPLLFLYYLQRETSLNPIRIKIAELILICFSLFLFIRTIYFIEYYYIVNSRNYIIFEHGGRNYAIIENFNESTIALEINKKTDTFTKNILIIPKDEKIEGSIQFLKLKNN